MLKVLSKRVITDNITLDIFYEFISIEYITEEILNLNSKKYWYQRKNSVVWCSSNSKYVQAITMALIQPQWEYVEKTSFSRC